jgi:hypothetical protein
LKEIANRMKSMSHILVLCENNECRAAAVAFCDGLVKRFWASREFDIKWFSFADLGDQGKFDEAVAQAKTASMLIASMKPGSDIPPEVHAWAEAWVAGRGEREGSMIALGDPGHIAAGGVSENFVYLRSIAHRAGLDYLTEMPENMGQNIPERLEAYPERAQQVTNVLDQILQRKMPATFNPGIYG